MIDQVITVSYVQVVGRAKQYPYWQPALYGKYKTQSGRIVSKYVKHIGTARRSFNLAEQDAIRYSMSNNIPYRENVRQYNDWTGE